MTQHRLGTEERPLRVAVIGSGPSAFYAVEALFKAPGLAVCVDVFDRLPTPYGLVRGGVAPDHQKIKSVTKVYVKIAANPGFRFFGNVMLGRDIEVADLMELYDRVIYAVGNESDRGMGLPGEDELAGVHSATEFVGWYNGHPDYRDREFDLANAKRIAVVGNGNVAMDVARVLARNPEKLAETDIADYALDALRNSGVREVLLWGRRGPAQAAFSPKEIQEIGELETVDLVVDSEQVEVDEVTQQWLDTDAPRSAHRNLTYLTEHAKLGEGTRDKKVRCEFLVSPVELTGEGGRISAVKLQHNELYASDDGTPRPRAVERFTTEEVQLVFKAIGYRGVKIDGVPFDDSWGIIPNQDGRVLEARGGAVVERQYVVGWAKRGPTGLIGTNSLDSKATVAALLEDMQGETAVELAADEAAAIERLLERRKIDFVSYEDWQRLDAYEVQRGEEKGKVRDKLTSVEEMLAVVAKLRQ